MGNCYSRKEEKEIERIIQQEHYYHIIERQYVIVDDHQSLNDDRYTTTTTSVRQTSKIDQLEQIINQKFNHDEFLDINNNQNHIRNVQSHDFKNYQSNPQPDSNQKQKINLLNRLNIEQFQQSKELNPQNNVIHSDRSHNVILLLNQLDNDVESDSNMKPKQLHTTKHKSEKSFSSVQKQQEIHDNDLDDLHYNQEINANLQMVGENITNQEQIIQCSSRVIDEQQNPMSKFDNIKQDLNKIYNIEDPLSQNNPENYINDQQEQNQNQIADLIHEEDNDSIKHIQHYNYEEDEIYNDLNNQIYQQNQYVYYQDQINQQHQLDDDLSQQNQAHFDNLNYTDAFYDQDMHHDQDVQLNNSMLEIQSLEDEHNQKDNENDVNQYDSQIEVESPFKNNQKSSNKNKLQKLFELIADNQAQSQPQPQNQGDPINYPLEQKEDNQFIFSEQNYSSQEQMQNHDKMLYFTGKQKINSLDFDIEPKYYENHNNDQMYYNELQNNNISQNQQQRRLKKKQFNSLDLQQNYFKFNNQQNNQLHQDDQKYDDQHYDQDYDQQDGTVYSAFDSNLILTQNEENQSEQAEVETSENIYEQSNFSQYDENQQQNESGSDLSINSIQFDDEEDQDQQDNGDLIDLGEDLLSDEDINYLNEDDHDDTDVIFENQQQNDESVDHDTNNQYSDQDQDYSEHSQSINEQHEYGGQQVLAYENSDSHNNSENHQYKERNKKQKRQKLEYISQIQRDTQQNLAKKSKTVIQSKPTLNNQKSLINKNDVVLKKYNSYHSQDRQIQYNDFSNVQSKLNIANKFAKQTNQALKKKQLSKQQKNGDFINDLRKQIIKENSTNKRKSINCEQTLKKIKDLKQLHQKYGYSFLVKLSNGRPVVAVGGGYTTIEDYIKRILIRQQKQAKLMEDEQFKKNPSIRMINPEFANQLQEFLNNKDILTQIQQQQKEQLLNLQNQQNKHKSKKQMIDNQKLEITQNKPNQSKNQYLKINTIQQILTQVDTTQSFKKQKEVKLYDQTESSLQKNKQSILSTQSTKSQNTKKYNNFRF